MKKTIAILSALTLVFALSSFTSKAPAAEISVKAATLAKGKIQADDIIGLWEPSNGKVRVKIEKLGTKYFGKIVWLRDPIDPDTKKPKTDKNNPDEKMRNVPLKGYRLLKDFTFNADDQEWADGTIYDPESGSLYSCVINMGKDVLNIRGYVGIKALGRTDTWKKIKLKKRK